MEIGLGQGADSEALVKRGAVYSGIDPTEESVKRVRMRFELKDVEYDKIEQASALAIPFPDDSFDIVFDAVGKLAIFSIRKALRRRGRYITTLPDNPSNIMAFFITPLLSLFGYRGRAAIINVLPSGPDLRALARLLEQRKLVPQIDRIYRLEEIAEAHGYSETGHARGKIVIEIS